MPAQLTATPLLLQKASSLPTGPLGSTESAMCNHTSGRSCLDQEGMLDPSLSRWGLGLGALEAGVLGLLGGLGKTNPGLQGEVGTELGRARTGRLDSFPSSGCVCPPLSPMSPIHVVVPSCSFKRTPGYFTSSPPENPANASESSS